jgi:hypothetical protein
VRLLLCSRIGLDWRVDKMRFDLLTRSLADRSSRRGIAGGIAGTALGLVAMRLPGIAEGKEKKAPKFNTFGCVNVGGKCRGKSGLCCSGICEGKKPKKGKKDKSRCIAHNSGECQPGEDVCLGNQVECGKDAVCARTTGNAPVCVTQGVGVCTECSKDSECQVLFGAGAACIICPLTCAETITGCFAAGA